MMVKVVLPAGSATVSSASRRLPQQRPPQRRIHADVAASAVSLIRTDHPDSATSRRRHSPASPRRRKTPGWYRPAQSRRPSCHPGACAGTAPGSQFRAAAACRRCSRHFPSGPPCAAASCTACVTRGRSSRHSESSSSRSFEWPAGVMNCDPVSSGLGSGSSVAVFHVMSGLRRHRRGGSVEHFTAFRTP